MPSGQPQGQYGPSNQNGRPRPPRAAPGADRPLRPQPPDSTTIIPKLDETDVIPKVTDNGHGRHAFPSTDPDEYQPRHGSFGEPMTTTIGNIGDRLGGYSHSDDDRTEYFGTDLVSQFAQDPDEFSDSGYHSPYDPDELGDSFTDRPPVAAPRERGRTVVRTLGEVLITAGMVVLLFVVYELYITNIFSAQKQANATTALNKEWDTVGATDGGRSNHYNLADGSGIAKLYIPSFGQDYVFTVIEGTTENDLAIGPGHYVGSALPGQPGDFAVAGHRVGQGAPFDDLGLLQSCDSILIETQTDWYVYRMLPMAGEVANWAATKGKTAQCSGPNNEAKVQPLGGIYAQTVGQEIVLPDEGDVVATVPHHYGATLSSGQEVSLLTLTTCNPKFSAAQRLIIHAVLVKDWTKDPSAPDKLPPEMKETS
jgi:sortase (surface protein transpeptidase)